MHIRYYILQHKNYYKQDKSSRKMDRKESQCQRGLELSTEDAKYFTDMLKKAGCAERRINEIISEYRAYITPEAIKNLRNDGRLIYDFIAPKAAYHDI